MFKHDLQTTADEVNVTLDGESTNLPSGMSVAAALLSKGHIISRISPSSKKPCSPHCLMGVCYECLMDIDLKQQQACMTEVSEGMVIDRHLDTGKEV